jgi:hypothetical protein
MGAMHVPPHIFSWLSSAIGYLQNNCTYFLKDTITSEVMSIGNQAQTLERPMRNAGYQIFQEASATSCASRITMKALTRSV